MGMISKDTIEKVLASTDIVDLIGSYIPLKKAGTSHKACCPFHHEKSASFNVSAAKQFYHCFGCGASGNAIGFVMAHEGLLFTDAVKRLATRAGVLIEEQQDDPKAQAVRRSRGKLLDLHREAAAFFHERMLTDPSCQHARDYLKSRGFGKEMAARWEIGWMPEDGIAFLDWAKKQKYSGKELVASGLTALRDEARPSSGLYVRFRDRLMFPIRNEAGDVIAFSGRQLKEDKRSGKYINSPETDIFKKSNVLFALDKAKKAILKEKSVILCEGQIDAISCHENGIENAIAPLGTAFTAQHARMLKRYSKTAILCFDADSAGINACERAFRELAPEGLSVKVVQLPAGDDPDTFLRAHGSDAFRTAVAEALDFFEFKILVGKKNGRMDSAEGRAELSRECTELLATMSDAAARDQQLNVVSSMLALTSATFRSEIGKAIKRKAAQSKTSNRAQGQEADQDKMTHIQAVPLDRTLAYLCQLALTSAPAQHFLAEQFETLHEAKAWVEGVGLLEKILSAAPDPESSAAVNAFMAGLKLSEQMALHKEMGAEQMGAASDGIQAAEQALGMLSSTVIQKRDAAVKAALKEPNLTPQRMMQLLEEAKEIAGLLRWSGRSVYDDELPKETVKPIKKPWENWKSRN